MSFEGSLFRTASNREWLDLLDGRYEYGIEIAGPLSGSRSKGMRAAVYLGFYLTASNRRRAACVVKVGLADAIARDYHGWLNFARRQPSRSSFAAMSPPIDASFGAIVVIDFIGSSDAPLRSLADVTNESFSVLPAATAMLVRETLAPLHEFRQDATGTVPYHETTQGELLRAWLTPQITKMALARVADVSPDWDSRQVTDPILGLTLPNALPDFLNGRPQPTDARPVRLPLGAVHGDPNFDNVFLDYAEDPVRIAWLALIDFEWCRCGATDSPFDDLARLECETLLGPHDLRRARELILSLVLGDSWASDGRPLCATAGPEEAAFAAVQVLRQRAGTLATATRAGHRESFRRGYLVTLLGQATRYVAYDGPSPAERGHALFYCQVLAAQLASSVITAPKVRFSTAPQAVVRGSGSVQLRDGAYALEATDRGAYAVLLLADVYPRHDFRALCEIEVLATSQESWLAMSTGVDSRFPERSGLAALLRWHGLNRARASIYSHSTSKHHVVGRDFSVTDTGACRLTLTLVVLANVAEFSVTLVEGSRASSLSLPLPASEYFGPIAVTVFSSRARILSLDVHETTRERH